MLNRRQIQKIVKQAYPSGMFISGEQKQLRKILMQDIMSDLEQNPDITYQEAAAHYIDTAELASVNEQPHLPKHRYIDWNHYGHYRSLYPFIHNFQSIYSTYLLFLRLLFYYSLIVPSIPMVTTCH